TDLRAVLNAIFYLLRTGCQWRLLPRLCSRAPAPFTITFVPGKNAGVLAELQRALHEQARLKPRPLALPFGGHPGQSVGPDHRARRRPWFRWAQTGQRAQTPPTRGHPGDGGGPSGRSRQCVGPTRGGTAACRLTIWLPEHPDGDGRCRLREPQAGARATTASRVATAHHQTPAARLQGSGPDLDRGAHVCVAGQKSSLEQRLRVEGSKLRKPSSTWRPSASCSNGSPRGKTSQTPSKTPRQQKNYVVDVRNAIRSRFGEDHPALKVVGFDEDTWTQINKPIHDRVEDRNQNTRFLKDPDAIVQRAET